MKLVEVNDIKDDKKSVRKLIDIDKIVSIEMTPNESMREYCKTAAYEVRFQGSEYVYLSYDELVKLLKLLPKAEKL